MLYRAVTEDLLCITQPAHAWLAGQLARAWDNDTFSPFAPYEDVCLGAEQHDIGWLPWENAPTLNLKTGHPHNFTEIPVEVHTKLWAGAKQLAMPMGRYVALLVSLHGTGLYERFTSWQRSPDSTRMVEAFLQQEKEFQQQLMMSLKQNPDYEPFVTPEVIARNQKLVATWDALSLVLCIGFTQEKQVGQVPIAQGETTLTLTPINHDCTQVRVTPWCFKSREVNLTCEGRILQETFPNEQTMRQALEIVPWKTLKITLRPN
jgi:hypothetical protein